jgi:hypothetical protein
MNAKDIDILSVSLISREKEEVKTTEIPFDYQEKKVDELLD